MYKQQIKQSSNVTVEKDKDSLYEDEHKKLKNIIRYQKAQRRSLRKEWTFETSKSNYYSSST